MPAINNQPNVQGVYLNTTVAIGATPTVAATFPTRANKAYGAIAKVTATETNDFDEQAFYFRAALFKNDGGTLSLVGAVSSIATIESTAGWDCTLRATGTNIEVLVTGAAATVISWKVDLEVHEAGKYVDEQGIVS